ncbi:hypothetical protein IEQ34_006539 [Dendrobium chrysotoxum]|uniref:Uncharacterized protein n=1 Tax=Dendrobium chrysotoxum TaxID=161865 RepID=A0AAV7H6Z0_DENCH|nr:hypothetical protein IEQ34_006539 [Dendrobium chrysotoxum]
MLLARAPFLSIEPMRKGQRYQSTRPWQKHIRDDAIRVEIPKHSIERNAKEDKVLILTPLREAEVGGREGDDVEINGVIDCGADDLGIGRGRQDGYAGASCSEELGHVDQGEHVTLRHEREEKHVEILWSPSSYHHPPPFNSLLIPLWNPIIVPISYHPNK